MVPAGWVWIPADSSHPRGPRGAHEASQPWLCPRGGHWGRRGGRWCESLLASFCPAFPRLREQIFRLQSVALMSLGSQDYRRPGVREQGWGFFIIIGRASLCKLQVAAGCQSLTEEGCGGRAQTGPFRERPAGGGALTAGPPSPSPLSFPSLPQLLFKGVMVVILAPFKKSFSGFSRQTEF